MEAVVGLEVLDLWAESELKVVTNKVSLASSSLTLDREAKQKDGEMQEWKGRGLALTAIAYSSAPFGEISVL